MSVLWLPPSSSGEVFDQLAPDYDVTWTNSPHGRAQRDVVWREIHPLFHPGQHILDLGCGTGEDALHLAARGIHVHAIDSSSEMVHIANGRGASARQLRIEDLNELKSPFDGALSNFGALNCVADLEGAGAELARLIRPDGYFAACIMPRLAWAEIARLNFRRWNPRATWRGIRVYYPTNEEMVRTFPDFRLVRRRSIAWGDHCLFIFRRK